MDLIVPLKDKKFTRTDWQFRAELKKNKNQIHKSNKNKKKVTFAFSWSAYLRSKHLMWKPIVPEKKKGHQTFTPDIFIYLILNRKLFSTNHCSIMCFRLEKTKTIQINLTRLRVSDSSRGFPETRKLLRGNFKKKKKKTKWNKTNEGNISRGGRKFETIKKILKVILEWFNIVRIGFEKNF